MSAEKTKNAKTKNAKAKNAKAKKVENNKIETTGHNWDGIEEYNNPLPRCWVVGFYVTIVFSALWWILYPSWPLINGATQGLLGYDSREAVEQDIAKWDEVNLPLDEALVAADYSEIESNEELRNYAVNGGGTIFATYCEQCHGAGAGGAIGYPNLTDDDWVWGGTHADIEFTIRHGVNDEVDVDSRVSEMPAFKGQFDATELDALVGYVESLSGSAKGEFDMEVGKGLFAENCASCHGEDGKGDRTVGAPNLADAIWLHSDGPDGNIIREGILNGRKNAMPNWGERFDDAQIKQITLYVHQKGGGE